MLRNAIKKGLRRLCEPKKTPKKTPVAVSKMPETAVADVAVSKVAVADVAVADVAVADVAVSKVAVAVHGPLRAALAAERALAALDGADNDRDCGCKNG
jgi:hypothetical protein